MGMFSGVESVDQIVNILLAEGPMWNLMKIVSEVSEKKRFKDFSLLYVYTAQRQEQITPEILTVSKHLLL